MKRYRILGFDWDSRATALSMKIKDEWPEEVKESWRRNIEAAKEDVLTIYGRFNGDQKIQNLSDLGNAPFSVFAFHNKFLRQIRNSFIQGSYYPALTGATCLGERILNQLIINLRNDFKGTDEYKNVRKGPYNDWKLMIDTLESWGVLLPEVVKEFKILEKIRNREAVHFNPATDSEDRGIALKAIKSISEVIKGQFPGLGLQPWFIEGTSGEFYIKKEFEKDPFVKKIYLPNCRLVGPKHRTIQKIVDGKLIMDAIDHHTYEDKQISDEEFWKLREKAKRNP